MMLWADRNAAIGAHLLPEEKERLKNAARESGKSMSFIISEAVTAWLNIMEMKKVEE